ncbi:Hypothetical predicted protein [Podarcis lilfordi]|uniref:Uncharacterized protein n=1 Tax=Podarcis lilfordi TaxID=74358 RepID=A0AA35JTG0_9SAUR|nr:Hypothetical predicted protein [Podarcis lilfordi]
MEPARTAPYKEKIVTIPTRAFSHRERRIKPPLALPIQKNHSMCKSETDPAKPDEAQGLYLYGSESPLHSAAITADAWVPSSIFLLLAFVVLMRAERLSRYGSKEERAVRNERAATCSMRRSTGAVNGSAAVASAGSPTDHLPGYQIHGRRT